LGIEDDNAEPGEKVAAGCSNMMNDEHDNAD